MLRTGSVPLWQKLGYKFGTAEEEKTTTKEKPSK
jgi:hypothetical protein